MREWINLADAAAMFDDTVGSGLRDRGRGTGAAGQALQRQWCPGRRRVQILGSHSIKSIGSLSKGASRHSRNRR